MILTIMHDNAILNIVIVVAFHILSDRFSGF